MVLNPAQFLSLTVNALSRCIATLQNSKTPILFKSVQLRSKLPIYKLLPINPKPEPMKLLHQKPKTIDVGTYSSRCPYLSLAAPHSIHTYLPAPFSRTPKIIKSTILKKKIKYIATSSNTRADLANQVGHVTPGHVTPRSKQYAPYVVLPQATTFLPSPTTPFFLKNHISFKIPCSFRQSASPNERLPSPSSASSCCSASSWESLPLPL